MVACTATDPTALPPLEREGGAVVLDAALDAEVVVLCEEELEEV